MMRATVVAIVATLAAAGVGRAFSAEPKPGDLESKTHPGIYYRLSKSFDGVITADDFNGERPDPKIWEIRQTPELKVFLEDGTLHIKGVWPKDARRQGNMIGAFSRPAHSPRTRILNGVMAGKVKFNHAWEQAGFERSPAMQFHYCGTSPDMNVSIARMFRQGKVRWGTSGGGGLGHRVRLTGQTGELPADVAKGVPTTMPADPEALASLDDREWQTLFISQYRSTVQCYMLGAKRDWLAVGPPFRQWLNVKRIELKMLYAQPGFNIDVEFDDARIYPHPVDHPVRVAIWAHDSQDPRRGWPFTVKLVGEDGGVLGRTSGGPGGDLLDITLPVDVLYPISARLQVYRGEKLDVEFPIARSGVKGLYPGDIWQVYCVPPPRPSRASGRP
jgi:hypothetical protein